MWVSSSVLIIIFQELVRWDKGEKWLVKCCEKLKKEQRVSGWVGQFGVIQVWVFFANNIYIQPEIIVFFSSSVVIGDWTSGLRTQHWNTHNNEPKSVKREHILQQRFIRLAEATLCRNSNWSIPSLPSGLIDFLSLQLKKKSTSIKSNQLLVLLLLLLPLVFLLLRLLRLRRLRLTNE